MCIFFIEIYIIVKRKSGTECGRITLKKSFMTKSVLWIFSWHLLHCLILYFSLWVIPYPQMLRCSSLVSSPWMDHYRFNRFRLTWQTAIHLYSWMQRGTITLNHLLYMDEIFLLGSRELCHHKCFSPGTNVAGVLFL